MECACYYWRTAHGVWLLLLADGTWSVAAAIGTVSNSTINHRARGTRFSACVSAHRFAMDTQKTRAIARVFLA
jgi:hypothetical protein